MQQFITSARNNIVPGNLTDMIGPHLSSLNNIRMQGPTMLVPLITGGQDESSPTPTNCALERDTFTSGGPCWKATVTGAQTWQALFDPPQATWDTTNTPIDDPFVFGNASYIVTVVEVTDATKHLSTLYSRVYCIADVAGATTPTGYNQFAISAADYGTLLSAIGVSNNTPKVFFTSLNNDETSAFGSAYALRLVGVTNDSVVVKFAVYACVPKPQCRMIFVADRGYPSFFQYAYPDLKARGIPVTVAVDCTLMTGATADTGISVADLQAYMRENGNTASMHAWAGQTMTDYTDDQAQADTIACLKWLSAKLGIHPMWRASWTGNTCAGHAGAQSILPAYVYAASGPPIQNWPLGTSSYYNVMYRTGLHRGTETEAQLITRIDNLFDAASRTSAFGGPPKLCVVFTHGYSPDASSANNLSPAGWAHFLSKLDTEIAAGTVKFGTFESHVAELGWRTERSATLGRVHIRVDPDGTETVFPTF